ncbi:MAG: type IV secretory system conjugative DNA transfer family protein [Acidimicrobiales bacterium]
MSEGEAAALAALQAAESAGRGGIYLGAAQGGMAFAPQSTSVAALGPTRTGKTSCVVVPAVLAAPGAVASTSTKTDVLELTYRARMHNGPCFLYDPTGTTSAPPGVELLHWSPLAACRTWSGASFTATNMAAAARAAPNAPYSKGGHGNDPHWVERATAMLAVLMHAAASADLQMATVVSWVDTRRAAPGFEILEGARLEGTELDKLASDLMTGLASTEQRELSGIWSTTSELLTAYRTREALDSTVGADFDPRGFLDARGTLYVCATGRHQAFAAPMVIGLLNELTSAAYARFASSPARTRESIVSAPLLLALDEAANIAPLPDLPAIVSEGGGQGVVVLACLQDLSQAEQRWGLDTTGFLAKFTTTVMLPGIRHVPTLQAVSTLAGEVEVLSRSVTTASPPGGWRRAGWGDIARRLSGHPYQTSVTTSSVFRPRLPVDVIARGRPGHALVLGDGARIGEISLTPWYATEPWRSAVGASLERSRPDVVREPQERGMGLER